MKKPYSAKRWHDNPGGIFSDCGQCTYWKGFCKCDKYEKTIPQELMDKSFPGLENYDPNYCPYRNVKNTTIQK